MDWNLIAWIAGQGALVGLTFWLGLTVGYRVKLRRASRLTWPDRPDSTWSAELKDEAAGIELATTTQELDLGPPRPFWEEKQ